jgi:hypothetical protein
MLLNSECSNPTRLAGTRGSAFVYGLELAPSVQTAYRQGTWYDSRIAALMRTLARDFDTHLYTYACKVYPPSPSTPTPLSAQTCTALKKDWVVLYDKLRKCVSATDQPKNSWGAEACTSLETQLGAFATFVGSVPLNGPAQNLTIDPNNYVGELQARMRVLVATYYQQFLTSLGPDGFLDPNN